MFISTIITSTISILCLTVAPTAIKKQEVNKAISIYTFAEKAKTGIIKCRCKAYYFRGEKHLCPKKGYDREIEFSCSNCGVSFPNYKLFLAHKCTRGSSKIIQPYSYTKVGKEKIVPCFPEEDKDFLKHLAVREGGCIHDPIRDGDSRRGKFS